MRPGLVIFLGLLLAGCQQSYLMSEDGIRLAYEYRPVPSAQGVAILLHGLGSRYEEWYPLVGPLEKSGWSVMRFDFRGHGRSTLWRGKELNWREFTNQGILTMQRDIDAVLSWLEGQQEEGAWWLVGSSIGANLALVYAADHPEIQGVVLLSPGLNYRGVESQPAMAEYGKRPVLIVASRDDPGSAEIAQLLYEEAQGPKKLILFDEAGHGTEMLAYEKELKEEVIAWMNQHTL